MTEKEEILYELDVLTTMSSKFNMKDSAQAAKCLKLFETKNIFKSKLGQDYIQQLKRIQNGSYDNLCFVCKTNQSHDGVLCDDCMDKCSGGKKHFFAAEEVPEANVLPTPVSEHKADPASAPEHKADPASASKHKADPASAPEHKADPASAPKHKADSASAPEHKADPGPNKIDSVRQKAGEVKQKANATKEKLSPVRQKLAMAKKKLGKKGLIGILIAIAAFLFITFVIKWRNLFLILALIGIGVLIYRIIKKQPKKIAVIYTIIMFGLYAVFSQIGDSGTASGRDGSAIKILTMNKNQIEKMYGEGVQQPIESDEVKYNYADGMVIHYEDGEAVDLSFSSSDLDVYGVTVGDDSAAFFNKLKDKGYSVTSSREYDGGNIYGYTGDKYWIMFWAKTGRITAIEIGETE